MRKSTTNIAIARGLDSGSDLDKALPASTGEGDMSSVIATAFSRRSFLYGLGALSLSACGGGESSSAEEASAASSETALSDASSESMATVLAATTGAFVHPGLLHTDSDFARMKAKLSVNASPWVDGYKKLTANRHAQLAYVPHPQTVIYRNDGVHDDNFMAFAEDVAAAYSCALRWRIENDNAYADKAVQIMNAWSSQLTGINTTDGHYDGFLVAGIQGYQFANAGEIMRSYSGWAATDFARFQNMMRKVFYPMNAGFITAPAGTLVVYSSWDLCAMAAVMAIGVLCDDRTMFNAAITYFKSGFGNGAVAQTVYYIHPGYLGQTQESGRDQGHNTLSISLLTSICEMAWNQGFDLYGYDNNRVLAAAEYVARGNLIQSGTTYYAMPFATYWNGSVTDTVFSTDARGLARAEWALIYNHYANRQGLAAPYTKKFAALVAPEGGNDDYGFSSGAYDQLGYGTLTCTRDPLTTPDRVPSGLTAVVSGGKVILSWWGSARATSYRVWRSTTSTGGYRPLTPTVTEPLTFTDSGLAPGKYYYCVSAVISSGQTVSETALSSAVTAVTSVEPYIVLPFNDGSGSTAADSTGGGHPGHLMNANWTSGRKASSSAAAFNGSSSYVALPTGVLTSIADFTISAWVYWNGVSNWERVFDFGTGVRQYMYLTPRRDTGVACFGITANGGVGAQEILGSASLPAGQWVHVAVTLSGNVGTLYVNGRAAGTNTAMQFAPFRLGNTAQNWIGRSQYATDPYFNGKICDFRIYQGALTAAQIVALVSA